jgi:hypothetical protein
VSGCGWRLEFGGGFGLAVLDGGLERGVVALVLFGVGFGEVGRLAATRRFCIVLA